MVLLLVASAGSSGGVRSSRVHLTLIGMRRAVLPTGPLEVATEKQWVKLEKVAGSAAGARVGSLLWGSAASVLTVAVSWGTSSWWIGACVCLFAAAAFVRSLFLGVWVEPGAVVVCTWFRRRLFRSGEIVAVDMQLYYGAGGAGVGWLPFVGSVRMIELERVEGKRVPLPSTIGRRNHVLRLARRMREALDLPLR